MDGRTINSNYNKLTFSSEAMILLNELVDKKNRNPSTKLKVSIIIDHGSIAPYSLNTGTAQSYYGQDYGGES